MSGLPTAYQPGLAYEVTLRWDEPVAPHGAQLELLTERSESPEVLLPIADAVPPSGRCESSAEGEPAAHVQTAGARRVVGVRDCGASELTFRFVAPNARRLAFSAAVVRSDSSGTADGDGVSELRTVLYPVGAAPTPQGCTAGVPADADGSHASLLIVALSGAVVLCRRRYASRRLALSSLVLLCGSTLAGCYQPEASAAYVLSADATTISHQSDAELARDQLDATTGSPPTTHERDAEQQADAGWQATGLRVRVRTAPFGGRYAPRNIGAVWIEDAQGGFVKTLARWAGTRAMYLRSFNASSQGDLTDAVTSATLSTHELHELTWDLRDRAGARVPSGMYQLAMETTDRDASGATHRVSFTCGQAPFLMMPPGTEQFQELELRLE